MKQKINQIGIYFYPEDVKFLDEASDKLRLSRSAFVRIAVQEKIRAMEVSQ